MIAETLRNLKLLQQRLAKIRDRITIVYFTEDLKCRHCRLEKEVLVELAELSDKLDLEVYNFTEDSDIADQYGIDKVPGLVLVGQKDYGVRYYGMPSDMEFQMLFEDMVRISSGHSGLASETVKRIGELQVPLHLEVLTTPACPFSEDAARLAHQLAMESEKITADLVNVTDFPELMEKYDLMAAPTVAVNGEYHFYGALDEPEFVEEVMKTASAAAT